MGAHGRRLRRFLAHAEGDSGFRFVPMPHRCARREDPLPFGIFHKGNRHLGAGHARLVGEKAPRKALDRSFFERQIHCYCAGRLPGHAIAKHHPRRDLAARNHVSVAHTQVEFVPLRALDLQGAGSFVPLPARGHQQLERAPAWRHRDFQMAASGVVAGALDWFGRGRDFFAQGFGIPGGFDGCARQRRQRGDRGKAVHPHLNRQGCAGRNSLGRVQEEI